MGRQVLNKEVHVLTPSPPRIELGVGDVLAEPLE
jgi:hypothetical protein